MKSGCPDIITIGFDERWEFGPGILPVGSVIFLMDFTNFAVFRL